MSFKKTLALALCAAPLTVFAQEKSFNPDLSLILDGRYTDALNEAEYELPGFMLGGEAGNGEQGFALGHSELVMSANIDDMYYGKMTAALHAGDEGSEFELEEAYIETLQLGHGLTVKAGRFFSNVGYLNTHHAHSWDFADAPLIYRGLFGDQLFDDGVQLRWVAPTEVFMQIGAEVGRGAQFPAGGASNEGSGTQALFVEFGGDVGASHSWQLGLSRWEAEVGHREGGGHAHGHAAATEVPVFHGDSEINALDFVWKWAPNGNSTDRSLKFQFEYFERDESGDIEMEGSTPLEESTYDGTQKGWYTQVVYQFMPKWRVGVRYDQLESDNHGSDEDVLGEAGLDSHGHEPSRTSLMLDYSRSEFSRLRLQYNQDDSSEHGDESVMLQYVMSLGSHGAHQF